MLVYLSSLILFPWACLMSDNNKLINRGSRSHRSIGSVAVTLLFALAIWFFNGGAEQVFNQSGRTSQPSSQSQTTQSGGGLVEANSSTENDSPGVPVGMPIVTIKNLPPEAVETIDLIWSDGPYPFDKDDTTFGNREGLLPDKSRGYYREYTVVTPGLDHRGARRIVAGADGELYYTDDHYESFAWVNTE